MLKNGLNLSAFVLLVFMFFNCNNSDKVAPTIKSPKELNKINFFLETSASMKGYMRGGADFSKMIPNFLIDIENRINSKNKTININFISDTISPYSKSTRDFIHDISTTVVAINKSSEMHNIFEMVTNKTDSNDISIFVSDCILSYSVSNINENREINRSNAEGELKAFIKNAFFKLKKRNICASLYGFNSNFFGTYYTYQNSPVELKGDVKRPFYIWVIGDKELLQKFNKDLLAIESFKPELAIDFGIFDKPIDSYSILFKTEKVGNWASNDKSEISEIEISKTKPIKFAIAVDLSTLPNYVKDTGYLKSSLKSIFTGGSCSIDGVRYADEKDLSEKAATREKEALKKSTHVIILKVSDMYKDGQLSLKLPLKYDTGYVSWSIMDDKNKTTLGSKTFAFEHLVNGVREAYQNSNDNFISFSITLKK